MKSFRENSKIQKAGSFYVIIFFLWCIFLSDAYAVSEKNLPRDIHQGVSVEPPLTFTDCYTLALKQSETIAINQELIRESEARFLQSLGSLLPHASFISTDTKEEKLKSSGSSSGSLVSSISPSRSSERKFNVKQTLFSGFKELAGILGSQHEQKQRSYEKARAELLLLMDVAGAFYLLNGQRQDMKAVQRIRIALLSRIDELKKRVNLGRSRPSEVVNAEVQLHNAEAEIELVKSREAVARQLLEFLIGRPVGALAYSDRPMPPLNPEIFYISKTMIRSDVKAAKQAWEVSRKQIVVANSEFLPTVTAEGNYYTQRTGFQKGIDWDIMLKVEVPLFEGTETIGSVLQALAQARESELTFMRTKRKAVEDIRDAYVQFQTGVVRVKALKKALAAAKLNYHLQKKDYRMNLVNNLDVLASIQSLETTARDYIQAYYEMKRLYWQLRVATEDIPADRRLDDAF